jgi:SpoVK/Ycf46/Vps4 family AAA+-type ATPase
MALTDVLQRRGVTLAPVRGVLICGASGTGKSALAKSFLSDRCLE